MAIGKPTHPHNKWQFSLTKDGPPHWYGGTRIVWNKQWGSGAKHSGPSGKRYLRYRPPVDDGKPVTLKK